MNAAEFDARYRLTEDPWNYRDSRYERDKYAATLEACGAGPFASALELGSSIGVFTGMLAPRCTTLTTIDFSAAAVAIARRDLKSFAQIRSHVGEIPAEIPPGSYDLIVASEVLYYLTDLSLRRTVSALAERLSAGGRLVVVHWRPTGPERPLSAEDVHQEIRRADRLSLSGEHSTEDYLLDVLVRHG